MPVEVLFHLLRSFEFVHLVAEMVELVLAERWDGLWVGHRAFRFVVEAYNSLQAIKTGAKNLNPETIDSVTGIMSRGLTPSVAPTILRRSYPNPQPRLIVN